MKDKILAAAVTLAETLPLHAITRGAIARKVKCAPSLVTWYLGHAHAIRFQVLTQAAQTNNVKVIAGALSILPQFPGMVPSALQKKALKSLAA